MKSNLKIEALEKRDLLTGASLIGQGLSKTAYTAGQKLVQAVVPEVSESIALVQADKVGTATVGSEGDDLFTLLKPQVGNAYNVDGGAGYDVVALKEFLSHQVSLTAKQAVVSTDDGEFTINFKSIERVSLADGDHLIEYYDQMGRAGDFDVFVAEDMVANSTDVEGRIAIGGSAKFQDMGFGTRLSDLSNSELASSEPTLVVGKDLSFHRGSVAGVAQVGGEMGVTQALFNATDFASQAATVNFDAAHKHLIDVSNTLRAKAPTEQTNVTEWGAITMEATASSSVFELSKSQLENASSWNITAPDGATVIVNVAGDDIHVSNFQMSLNGQPLQSGSTAPFAVVLNFHDAKTLSSSAFSWQGQLLAPLADMTFNNGHINGKMFVKSLTGGGEYHLVPMEPNLGSIQPTTQTVFAIVEDDPSEPQADPPTSYATDLHDLTNCFDVFVLEDYSAQFTGVTGSVAVGGNADLTHVGIGTGVAEWINEDALVVAGNLTMDNALSYGPVAVGGQASGVAEAEVRKDAPIDFASVADQLTDFSQKLASLETSGEVETTPWNAVTISAADGSAGSHVFELDGALLAQAVSLDILADSGDELIINVTGEELENIGNFGFFINGEEGQPGVEYDFDLIFNFAEAKQVSTQYIAWVGTVLSPTAAWSFQDANIQGQLIVQSLYSESAGMFMGCDHGGANDDSTTIQTGGGTESTDSTEDNDAPLVGDDEFEVCFAEHVSGDVAANDSDPDGDELKFSITDLPTNGKVRLNLDGAFEYKPIFGYVGQDTFTYTAFDGNGGETTGTVTIDVLDCTPPEVDLAVSKTMTNMTAGVRWSSAGNSDQIAYPYDVLEYTISVTNLSDDLASSVVLTDVIPENIDVWKTGDSSVVSETGQRWDNNYWVGQLHTLDGFEGSPEFVDPTNGTVEVVEAGTAANGQTLSPGLDYGLLQGSLTWELGQNVQPGETVTLKYYGMREVYSAYNWSYGTQFSTPVSLTSLDQVDSDDSNNTAEAQSWWVSPVAIDLNGDNRIGVTGTSTAKGHLYTGGRLVDFDIDGDGTEDRIEWFSGDGDGILVDTYRIGPNNAVDGRALFGDLGGTFRDGYQKLAQLDVDGSQAIDGDELDRLALWIDDGDAVLEDGELETLNAHGVALISVLSELDSEGRLRSSARDVNGNELLTEDVWFATEA